MWLNNSLHWEDQSDFKMCSCRMALLQSSSVRQGSQTFTLSSRWKNGRAPPIPLRFFPTSSAVDISPSYQSKNLAIVTPTITPPSKGESLSVGMYNGSTWGALVIITGPYRDTTYAGCPAWTEPTRGRYDYSVLRGEYRSV